jgi:peptidyl-tRNA hydrolase
MNKRRSAELKVRGRTVAVSVAYKNLSAVTQSYERLQKQAALKREAKDELREAITEARQTHTLQAIGQALGMTRQGVYDILRR